MNTLKLATMSAFALALTTGAGVAQMMTDFDQDQNASVTQEEFEAGLSGSNAFSNYDADTDGMLNEDEYASFDSEGMLGDSDMDGDGMLSQDEYNQSMFSSFDADQSGDLNEEEFTLFEDDAAERGLFE